MADRGGARQIRNERRDYERVNYREGVDRYQSSGVGGTQNERRYANAPDKFDSNFHQENDYKYRPRQPNQRSSRSPPNNYNSNGGHRDWSGYREPPVEPRGRYYDKP